MTTYALEAGHVRRPNMPPGFGSAPGKIMLANKHARDLATTDLAKGIQLVDSDGSFGATIGPYLTHEKVIPAGFNYHLVSVFGSQSTGKSTLLNNLFGTSFGVMNEEERRQTTKGIWLAKNKKPQTAESCMAKNILVMDVEGTDGQERGEDQDFERKSALFALATSEILLVNMWETQVGLYHGANMGLLKTVFEVNLQLFVKDNQTIPRSLLLFVIRDCIGRTPVENLRKTLLNNLTRIWTSLSKPTGLEDSRIEDYFDFAFAALPHKLLQPEKFDQEVAKLGARFCQGYKDPKKCGLVDANSQPLLLPEYHRRIPADGFAHYAAGVWEQIMTNKDLDLPTQQELLAQFRCVEIARESMVFFDEIIVPLEKSQADAARNGQFSLIAQLGNNMSLARSKLLRDFEAAASRYHKGIFKRQLAELEGTVDSRLKILFDGQLATASKLGITAFADLVLEKVKAGASSGSQYDFVKIVEVEKKNSADRFEQVAIESAVDGADWCSYASQLDLFKKELDGESTRLRQEEMRLLANRIERWFKSHLEDLVGLEFSKLSSGQGDSGASGASAKTVNNNDHWDRVWDVFIKTVSQAENRFTDRARSFDASIEEIEVGIWRLRRKAWVELKGKINEEVAEGNLGMKLRENFEDGFRYDEEGVPRIWRPSDDIDRLFAKSRDQALKLIPTLANFRLSATSEPPPLREWLGDKPESVSRANQEDIEPVGGIDKPDESLEDETVVLTAARQADIINRFRKMADGVYIEAKRGALGGATTTPWWMWGLLLVLGQNEIFAVARNPFLIIAAVLLAAGAYTTFRLNLWGPMIRMSTAAWDQGLQIGKEKLREFLVNSETGRQAIAMEGRKQNGFSRRSQAQAHARNDHSEDDVMMVESSVANGNSNGRKSMPSASAVWDEN